MTIFELLKSGGKVEFSSGYILKGDPETNYIDTGYNLCGEYYADGLRILDKDGVRLAIADAKKYEKEQENA